MSQEDAKKAYVELFYEVCRTPASLTQILEPHMSACGSCAFYLRRQRPGMRQQGRQRQGDSVVASRGIYIIIPNQDHHH